MPSSNVLVVPRPRTNITAPRAITSTTPSGDGLSLSYLCPGLNAHALVVSSKIVPSELTEMIAGKPKRRPGIMSGEAGDPGGSRGSRFLPVPTNRAA